MLGKIKDLMRKTDFASSVLRSRGLALYFDEVFLFKVGVFVT